jgi:hypothetical protein
VETKKAGEEERPQALFLTGLRCDGPSGFAGLPLDSSSVEIACFWPKEDGFLWFPPASDTRDYR